MKVELTAEGDPYMVYFKDLNDPKSVFSVDPGNMEASFAREFRFSA
jgi:hypothetical protein